MKVSRDLSRMSTHKFGALGMAIKKVDKTNQVKKISRVLERESSS